MNARFSRVLSGLRTERGPGPVIMATIAVFVIFSAAAPGTFPTSANLQSIGFQLPETALLGLVVMVSSVVDRGWTDDSVMCAADPLSCGVADGRRRNTSLCPAPRLPTSERLWMTGRSSDG